MLCRLLIPRITPQNAEPKNPKTLLDMKKFRLQIKTKYGYLDFGNGWQYSPQDDVWFEYGLTADRPVMHCDKCPFATLIGQCLIDAGFYDLKFCPFNS